MVILILIDHFLQLFTRSKSRDTIHGGGDGDSGDWVQARSKEGKTERKAKSEIFSRARSKFSSREIPKFVLIVEDYSSVDTKKMLEESSIVVPTVSEDQFNEEESNEEVLESIVRNAQISTNAIEVQQGEEEDEHAKNPGAESEEKHDESVSNEAWTPAEDECEKNKHCEQEQIGPNSEDNETRELQNTI